MEHELSQPSLTDLLLEEAISCRKRVRHLEAEKSLWNLEKERLKEEVDRLTTENRIKDARISDLEDRNEALMSWAVESDDGDNISREDYWASRGDEE